ncbi:MAG: VWA domain-containing protein [Bryobacteraceae bacterium]|jgi:VWFA-related protein
MHDVKDQRSGQALGRGRDTMMGMVRPAAFLLFALTFKAFAQDEPRIRLDVQQVLVPVVVTDAKGHHVSGLHASDFRIFEDGVEQKIAAFSSDTAASVDDIGALTKAASNASGTTGSGASAPAAASAFAPPRRTFVICIDTLHTAPANAGRMREALENLFEKEKPADAQYALVGIGRQLQVLQPATANPLEILLKIRSAAFQGMMGGLDASTLAAQLASLRTRMDDFCRRCACTGRSNQSSCDIDIETLKQSVDAEASRWTAPTDALRGQFTSVVKELAKLPTARTLILVSDGFDINPAREFYRTVAAYLPNRPQFRLDEQGKVEPGLEEALKVASERNVTIFTVDSRGASAPAPGSSGAMDASSGAGNGFQSVTGGNRSRGAAASLRTGTLQTAADRGANPFASGDSASSATMEQLARSTGGLYLHGGSDLLKQFRSALAEGREYYMLAYVSSNGAEDGKFRRITVETKNKNLSIRAKSGYWAAGTAQ